MIKKREQEKCIQEVVKNYSSNKYIQKYTYIFGYILGNFTKSYIQVGVSQFSLL